MQKHHTILWAGVILMTASCSDINFTMEGYKQAVLSGLEQIPEARQMDELFGKSNVDHFISYHGSLDAGSTWNSEVFFADRYRLTMQVPVKMGRSFNEVLDVLGKPKFWLIEVTSIDISERSADVKEPTNLNPFGLDQWEKVLEAEGNFSVLGIEFKKDQPVRGFARYVAMVRRDRVQVDR